MDLNPVFFAPAEHPKSKENKAQTLKIPGLFAAELCLLTAVVAR